MHSENSYDVVIVGGSFAGLSAAMALGRSMRKVLIVDSGNPCNQSTPHSHNFITHDGKKPSEITGVALEQVLAYPTVTFLKDWVGDITGENLNFEVFTQKNGSFFAKKIIFATGVKDHLPEIAGMKECWGVSVIHCPYCHGYEVRGKKTGILVNDPMVIEYAKLILNWTQQLTIYANGAPEFEIPELEALGVSVVETEVAELVHTNGYLSEIRLVDGTRQPIEAIYHRPKNVQHSDIPAKLGCEMTEQGLLTINHFGSTTVNGVFAGGDCTAPFRSVAMAVASGTMAGAGLNHEMIQEKYED